MKLTVIGGGGVRSMFLAKSIAQRAEITGINDLNFAIKKTVRQKVSRLYSGFRSLKIQLNLDKVN